MIGRRVTSADREPDHEEFFLILSKGSRAFLVIFGTKCNPTPRKVLPSASVVSKNSGASTPILKHRSNWRLPMNPTKLESIDPRMTPKIVAN